MDEAKEITREELYKRAERVSSLELQYQLYQQTNVPRDPKARAELDLAGEQLRRELGVARALYKLGLMYSQPDPNSPPPQQT